MLRTVRESLIRQAPKASTGDGSAKLAALASLLSACFCSACIPATFSYVDESSDTSGSTNSGVTTLPECTGGSSDVCCEPGAMIPCYSGAPGTEQGYPQCKSGLIRCNAEGNGVVGTCAGEVPCTCEPNKQYECYSGPDGTAGIGACKTGTSTCSADGQVLLQCQGEVVPTTTDDTCGVDDNCDGSPLQCECPSEGTTESCYEGPNGTLGVGICKAGTHTCGADLKWGPCVGQVPPMGESCLSDADEDCDGQVNEGGPGCECSPGQTLACYSGPPSTAGVGTCHAGIKACVLGHWGPCSGEIVPQQEICGNAFDEDCSGATVAECGAVEKVFYTGGAGIDRANSVAFDSDGNLVAAGFEEDADWPAIAWKLNPSLASMWTTYTANSSGAASSWGSGIAVDSDNNVIANSTGTPMVYKLSPNGTLLWRIDADPIGGTSVSIDSHDDVIFAGGIEYTAHLPGNITLVSDGVEGAAVVKLSPTGNVKWAKRFGGLGDTAALGVATDGDDNIVLIGRTDSDPVDLGGDPQSGSDMDIFLVKLDSNGEHVWDKRFNSVGPQWGWAVDVDRAENTIVLLGWFVGAINVGCGTLTSTGGADILIAKLDSSGQCVWSKSFGGTNYDQSVALDVGVGGDIAIAGLYLSPVLKFGASSLVNHGDYDIFVAKFHSDGSPIWARSFGGESHDYGDSVALRADGTVALAGFFTSVDSQSAVQFDGYSLVSNGWEDAFVALLAP